MKPSALLPALLSSPATEFSVTPRPTLLPMPYNPRLPFPDPPRRSVARLCVVNTHNDGVTDDSFSIMYALTVCNEGGHVLFLRDMTYTIGSAMDLTFLRHIDIGMTRSEAEISPWCFEWS